MVVKGHMMNRKELVKEVREVEYGIDGSNESVVVPWFGFLNPSHLYNCPLLFRME